MQSKFIFRLPEAEGATKKSKTLERSKGRTSVKNSYNTNMKTESKKPSPKKTDTLVKKMGRPPKLETATENSMTGPTFDKTGPTKVETQGRRVSARSKKPGEILKKKNLFLVLFVFDIHFSVQQNWCCKRSLCFTPKRMIWIP